ncbi:MAG: hypothetical protein AB9921_06245 [Erysipelotrichaceae bacterium]
MKKYCVRFSLICLSILFCAFDLNANAYAELDPQEFKTSAYFDVSELRIGDEVVVYQGINVEDQLTVTLVKYTPLRLKFDNSVTSLSLGSTPWSGGTIPDGVSTLRIRRSGVTYYYQYYVDVRGYDSSIISIKQLAYMFPQFYFYQYYSFSIVRSQATDALPARSSFQFELTLVHTTLCYLDFELNSSGQIRTLWNDIF